jgi:hypothetical protein
VSNAESKASYDKDFVIAVVALIVSLLASILAGWQAMEARFLRHESGRAYVGLDFATGKEGRLSFAIRCTGNSPALHVAVKAGCISPKYYNIEAGSGIELGLLQTNGILLPGATEPFACFPETDEVPRLKKPEKPSESPQWGSRSLLSGIVTYEDVFHQQHFTKFCVVLTGELTNPCKEGNEAN